MFSRLMHKEVRLALQVPTALFQACALMILIPSYPYLVIFFYGLLGIFFVCAFGRENHDVEYTALLPVTRASIVRARFTLCACVELILWALTAVLSLLRPSLGMYGNDAGMVPDAAFFGIALLLMGLFNLVYFPMYYKNTNKIGVPFTIASIVYGIGTVAAEGIAIAAPVYVESPATRLWILAAGAALYVLFTWAGCRLSVRHFSRMDLTN